MSEKFPPGIWVNIKARVHNEPSPIPGETRVWFRSHNEDYIALVTDDWIDGPTNPPKTWGRCTSLFSTEVNLPDTTRHVSAMLRCSKANLHPGDHGVSGKTWTSAQESGHIDSD